MIVVVLLLLLLIIIITMIIREAGCGAGCLIVPAGGAHGVVQLKNAVRKTQKQEQRHSEKEDSFRESSVKIGTMQRILAWPLRKDDAHKSRSVSDTVRKSKTRQEQERLAKSERKLMLELHCAELSAARGAENEIQYPPEASSSYLIYIYIYIYCRSETFADKWFTM